MTNHPSFTIDLREQIALVLVNVARRQVGWQGELVEMPDVPESATYWAAADRILAIPAIAEAQERIAELEREVEGWAYAAQYPEG